MYLTPQHVLLAGATGLTGEHLLDRLLNEPTIIAGIGPLTPATGRTSAPGKPGRRPGGVSAAIERPRRHRLLLPGHHHQTGRLGAGVSRGGPGHGGGVRQTCPGDGRTAPDRDQRPGRRSQILDFLQPGQRRDGTCIARAGLAAADHLPTFVAAGRTHSNRAWPSNSPGLCRDLIPGKYRGIEACQLARAMWRLALEEQDGVRIVESDELRKLGK